MYQCSKFKYIYFFITWRSVFGVSWWSVFAIFFAEFRTALLSKCIHINCVYQTPRVSAAVTDAHYDTFFFGFAKFGLGECSEVASSKRRKFISWKFLTQFQVQRIAFFDEIYEISAQGMKPYFNQLNCSVLWYSIHCKHRDDITQSPPNSCSLIIDPNYFTQAYLLCPNERSEFANLL